MPHRVVLVETRSADDCEHVAHHVAHAARELGAVSVEVFAAGAELPAYHRAAVRAARPLGAASVAETAPLTPLGGRDPGGTPVRPRPTPGPSRGRADDEVPPFGVPVSAPSARLLPHGTDPGRVRGARRGRRVAADGGRAVPDRRRGGPRPARADRPRARPPGTPTSPRRTPRDTAEPGPTTPTPADPGTVAPSAPDPVDLDPESTAERIAALWRTPPPDEILSDEHPISSWAETSLGVSFGPGSDEPGDSRDRPWEAGPVASGPSVDPDAATGDIPVVRGPATTSPGPDRAAANGTHDGDLPGSNGEGRVRRARHSRSETGEFEAPDVDSSGPPPAPQAAPGPVPTNGHHHGPGHPDGPGDAVTGPVHRPAGASGAAASPTPPPTPPASSSGPDSVDSQLSDRERELLARLHEELASRERLEADAPDPLTGRPVAPPPGSEDATEPRPRPTGPYPGPGRPPGPPPGSNGHRPVNGHGLPRRRDHDGEDGASPGA